MIFNFKKSNKIMIHQILYIFLVRKRPSRIINPELKQIH